MKLLRSAVLSGIWFCCALGGAEPFTLESQAARNSDLVLMVNGPALLEHPQLRRVGRQLLAPERGPELAALLGPVRAAGFSPADFFNRYLFYANTITETGGMVVETGPGVALRIFEAARMNSAARSNVQTSMFGDKKLLVTMSDYGGIYSSLLLERPDLLRVNIGFESLSRAELKGNSPMLEGRALGENLIRLLALPRGLFYTMEEDVVPQEFFDLEVFDLTLSDRDGRLTLRIVADFTDAEGSTVIHDRLAAWLAARRPNLGEVERRLFDGIVMTREGGRLILELSFDDGALLLLAKDLISFSGSSSVADEPVPEGETAE